MVDNQEMEEEQGGGMEMCYVQVPAPHKECEHHVLQLGFIKEEKNSALHFSLLYYIVFSKT